MALAAGHNTRVDVLDDGKRLRVTSPATMDGAGLNISQFCRAAHIDIDVDQINQITLEMVGPNIDVIGKLKEVKVMLLCEDCRKTKEVRDMTKFGDVVRHFEGLNSISAES